ncbi:hypothetical protein IHQ68_14910 [Chelatococcus sambhunathii]|uniref:Uncharacterized protein n=1 Tax=Chelatococcus sambhunathii TaxID=363953 RepID=A0ABU1DJ49_9HYPH|nr:hypothetical protein [Chelatococcus sambhunathii]MDR4307910.1 hypothetical protein [Chelatococcus sambhunathii]
MSTDGKVTTGPDHPHEADLLAPWRAIDRLDAADAAALERMLADDPSLARRLEIAAEERDGTVALNEALPAPSRAAMDKLFAKIEAEEAARAPKTAGLMRWLSVKLSLASPSQLAFGATAAALVIALQAGLLAGAYLGTGEGTYETASAPSAETPVARPGATVLVAFEPGATAQQIAAALTEAKVEIVAGPKPGGVFVARALEGKTQDVVAALKAKKGVVKLATPGDPAP